MNPVAIAIRTEMETIEFYEKAAARTRNSGGRQMFLSMLQDERDAWEETSGMLKACRLNGTAKTIRKSSLRAQSLQGIRPETDEIGALTVSMEKERSRIVLFRKLLASVKTKSERTFFGAIIRETEEHYEKLSNTLAFLSDSSDWFLHEEHSIADGGTGWA